MNCQDCKQPLTGDLWLDRETHGRCSWPTPDGPGQAKNKQTGHISRIDTNGKIDMGRPISKAELAVHLDVSYTVVRSWKWLPMLGHLLFYADFVKARQRFLGLEFDPQIFAHLRKSNAGKSGKSLSKHD